VRASGRQNALGFVTVDFKPVEARVAKVLPFARTTDSADPHLDVCLVKGEERRRYLVVSVTRSTWESRFETASGTERRLVSRDEARTEKAQFELEIATRLGAGWVVEWNR
jgi:hypothetical protein